MGLEDATEPCDFETERKRWLEWEPRPPEDKARTGEVGQVQNLQKPMKTGKLANFANLANSFRECLSNEIGFRMKSEG